MKRSPMPPRKAPLRAQTGLSRAGRLNPVSKRRRGERDERQTVREEAMRGAGHRCEAIDLVPEVRCWGPLDVDEVIPRGVRPGAHLEADNVQVLCRAHHDWKHAHPQEAARRGLRRWSWDA